MQGGRPPLLDLVRSMKNTLSSFQTLMEVLQESRTNEKCGEIVYQLMIKDLAKAQELADRLYDQIRSVISTGKAETVDPAWDASGKKRGARSDETENGLQ